MYTIINMGCRRKGNIFLMVELRKRLILLILILVWSLLNGRTFTAAETQMGEYNTVEVPVTLTAERVGNFLVWTATVPGTPYTSLHESAISFTGSNWFDLKPYHPDGTFRVNNGNPNFGALHYHLIYESSRPTALVLKDPGVPWHEYTRFRTSIFGGDFGFGWVHRVLFPGSHENWLSTYDMNGNQGIVFFPLVGYGESFYDLSFSFYVAAIEDVIKAPVVTRNNDLDLLVGDPVQWITGIEAHWGWTHTNLIPSLGEILNIDLVDGTDLYFSEGGEEYEKIGIKTHTLEIRDEHSLSDLPAFAADDSFTSVQRKTTIRTTEAPNLILQYGASATDRIGNSMAGHTYDSSLSSNLCGGEAGWTNQPLDIILNPDQIIGDFDSVLKLDSAINTVAVNDIAKYENYQIGTPKIGRIITGVLTERNNNINNLSQPVMRTMKIDTELPIAAATHNGGFNFTDGSSDALSDLSDIHHSRIAIVPHNQIVMPADFNLFDDIPNLPSGNYDVYVWATDKAGNEKIAMILEDEPLGDEISITKNTDKGATLHNRNCLHNNIESLDPSCLILGCSLGANVQIVERSDLTYELVIDNASTTKDGTGTFTDYLPKGMTITAASFNGLDSSDNVTFTYGEPEPSGTYEGQIKVTGDYTIKAGSQINVSISCKTPSFDKNPGASNIISNQATNDWILGSGETEKIGTSISNFANHELLEMPGVETKFIKVGASDLNIGLANAEFALYKWMGAPEDYISGNHNQDILDANLIDGIAGSAWERVKGDGETGALSDVFISGVTGEVDLGILPSGIYTLIETKTPGGMGEFELPVGQWVIVSDHTKSDDGTPDDWKLEFSAKGNNLMPPAVIRIIGENPGDVPTYKIVNIKLVSLPMSGLGGTRGITIFGLTVMLLAGSGYTIYLHKKSKKRVANKNESEPKVVNKSRV